MASLEVISANAGIVRISLSARYQIADVAAYYIGSSSAGDAIFTDLRRSIASVARKQPSSAIVAAPEDFAKQVLDAVAPAAKRLGLEISELDIWDAVFVGRYTAIEESTHDLDNPSGTLVH